MFTPAVLSTPEILAPLKLTVPPVIENVYVVAAVPTSNVGPVVTPVDVWIRPLDIESVLPLAMMSLPVDELPSSVPPEIVMPFDIVWPVAELPILYVPPETVTAPVTVD